MKRKQILIWLMMCAAFLAFCACGSPESEGTNRKFAVRYYDGDTLLRTELRQMGETLENAPLDILFWRTEHGDFIDPSSTVVMGDVALYAWHTPTRREAYDTFLTAEDDRFDPDEVLERGDLAVLAQTLMEENNTASAPVHFSDVNAADPAHEAIAAVCAAGLMTGYPDGTFHPEDEVTERDLATVFYLLAGMPGAENAGLSKTPDESWGNAAVQYAREAGWMQDSARERAALTRKNAAVLTVGFRGALLTAEDAAALYPESPYSDVAVDDPAYAAILEASYRTELLDCIMGTAEGVEPGLMLIGEKLCHMNAETRRLDRFEAGFQLVDGELYRASEAGYFLDRMEEGLCEIDGSMYCVTQTDGPFMTDDDFGYLHFGEDGRYTSGSVIVDEAVDDLLCDILTNNSLSQREKLYRGYCAIRDGGFYYRARNAGWVRGSTYWSLECAETMFTEKYGMCYYWAAAFLYVARRVGYQAYPVCGGVGTRNQVHAWVVVIDGGEEYICDVELEWAYRIGFYDDAFAPTDMFMQPLDATKVIYVFPGEQRSSFYSTYGVSWEESDEDYLDIPPELQIPPEETENPEESPEPDESPAPEESPEPGESPAPGETPGEEQPTEPAETESPDVLPTPVEPEPAEPAPVEPEPVEPEPVEPEPVPEEPAPDGTESE